MSKVYVIPKLQVSTENHTLIFSWLDGDLELEIQDDNSGEVERAIIVEEDTIELDRLRKFLGAE